MSDCSNCHNMHYDISDLEMSNEKLEIKLESVSNDLVNANVLINELETENTELTRQVKDLTKDVEALHNKIFWLDQELHVVGPFNVTNSNYLRESMARLIMSAYKNLEARK